MYQVSGMSFCTLVYLRLFMVTRYFSLSLSVPHILGEARESMGTCQCLMMYCYVAVVQGVRGSTLGSDDTRTNPCILDSFNTLFSHIAALTEKQTLSFCDTDFVVQCAVGHFTDFKRRGV